jgi:hypothetical protein
MRLEVSQIRTNFETLQFYIQECYFVLSPSDKNVPSPSCSGLVRAFKPLTAECEPVSRMQSTRVQTLSDAFGFKTGGKYLSAPHAGATHVVQEKTSSVT